MDESDEDFKELCASFFQRVRKNGTKDTSGERKRQRASHSARTRSTLPCTKQPAVKSTPAAGPPGRKRPPGSRAPGTKPPAPAPTRGQEHGPASPEDGEGGALAPATPAESRTRLQTGRSQRRPPGPSLLWGGPTAQPLRADGGAGPAADAALQEGRPLPAGARHPLRPPGGGPPGGCSGASRGNPGRAGFERYERAPLPSGAGPFPPCRPRTGAREPARGLARARMSSRSSASAGSGPGLPVTGSDAAGQGGSLEEEELFLCQICQRNLSTMNVTRREQHVNRCLDEAEKTARPLAPQTPECPICGKPLLTPKSRASHLKQCAARMEVGPQLLLQAVRLQNAQPAGAPAAPAPSGSVHPASPHCPLPLAAPSAGSLGGGLKRKAAPGKKEPQKRRRVSRPEAPSEDLLVAMALSRSELEAGPAALRPGCEWLQLGAGASGPVGQAAPRRRRISDRWLCPPEKKSRKKRAVPPPQLLVQDAETTGRQIEDRVARLLAEEAEVASTPPLPAGGRLGEELERASWWLCPPAGKRNPLWEGSALTQAWAPDAFYTASLVPPLEPQRPATVRPLCPGSCLSLSLLAADLGAMVNNPQLSDVQFQTDSGELLHAHKFVLYARCPLLMQHVNSEGFCAAEDGGPPTQRVLLSDVSTEAARAFLHYLYTADTRPPPQLAPDLASLARSPGLLARAGTLLPGGGVLLGLRSRPPGAPYSLAVTRRSPCRFGARELARLCEWAPAAPDTEGSRQEGQGEQDCESRAENFHELLRAVWAGEEEAEAEALPKPGTCQEDAEKVNEAEMEDIYEFTATQRKRRRGAAPGVEEQSGQLADSPGGAQATQTDSPGPGGGQTPGVRSSVRLCSGLPREAQRSHGEEGEEAPPGAPGPASPSEPPRGCRAGREAAAYLLSVDADGGEQPFLLTRGCPQTPQAPSTGEDGSHTGGPRGSGGPPASPCPHRLSKPPPQGASPRWPQPRPPLADGPAQPAPGSPQTPRSPARRRGRHGPSPCAPGCQEGWQQASLLGCRSAGVPVSPQKPLSIDLTQPQPSRTCSRPQSPPARRSRGHEVVILLDSDEEPEPQQPPAQAARDPPEDRKVLEVSTRSCELFPIIDVDADRDASQSPLSREASPRQAADPGSAGVRGPPRPLCGPKSSPGEESSSDASWLVPATPLAVRSHDASSQTQVLGLGSSLAAGPAALLKPSASSGQRGSPEAAVKPPVPSPRTSALGLAPEAPGSPCGGRRLCGSPGSAPPRDRRRTAPLARPLGTRLQHQLRSPPRPSTAHPAPAGEVVEVEDSGDEQERGSRPAHSSPLLDSELPAPVEDGCWHAEPPSPIPIGQLTLEHSGPLGTSSPSSGDCRALPPLGITPIRGSCRRGPWEASPGASPLGGSEQTFLNSALFGVRPLPKRQMVLKLKEIFQYTHQTLGSDAQEGSPPAPEAPHAAGHSEPGAALGPAPRRSRGGARGGAKNKGPQPRQQQPGGGVPAPSTTPAAEAPPGDGDADAGLPASQGAADSSGSSSGSQSSASCEFGLALESAGDEEREEGVRASQAAATEAALRHYIRSRPALYRRVLQYQPLELAELRAGLRQQGVRAAAGALLDFLDAQCITFTTAAARKEQLSRRRRRPAGRTTTGGARPGSAPPRP
ncbi:Structure-specific endonuclease subunit SLX4 [Galemys pyrenaicus]|uniref:Structure-specific endonuclease subunit SLX4 n=1 Tax=Galemys pyrenaicus TaxID=202257 RepID=A0A8J6DE61_GALPY|nr:Structure-specific endonuclease subunit SLX4 [Galemys pyrenaicus]